jgi:dihydroorotate dehydrogenase (fumarate)
MNINTTLSGLELEHPLFNAAGTCKTVEDVKRLATSATAAIMVGSITKEERTGNSGEVYWAGPMFSLNSLGLPNRGAGYYMATLPEMVKVAHGAGKLLFVNVAGFSPNEYADLASVAVWGGADLVELNLGCPNVWNDGAQKRIACFDPELVDQTLERVQERIGVGERLAVKISPFSDPFALAEVARVIGGSKMVKIVTTVNTFPNAFSYNKGKPRITPGGGLAGFAGPAMKPIGLGQVLQLRGLLPMRIQLVGVGGVTHGEDIREYSEYLDCFGA